MAKLLHYSNNNLLDVYFAQLPIQDQITEERENLIKLLSVSHEKVKNFDLSIRALSDEHEINLRYPLHDDPPPPEKFNVSILTELMNIYKIIELQQSIVCRHFSDFSAIHGCN